MVVFNDSTRDNLLQLGDKEDMPLFSAAPAGDEDSGTKDMGLSTIHICRKKLGSFTVWRGGGLVKVSKPKFQSIERKNCSARRGIITEFSRSSRRRLLRTVSKTKKENLPVFVTLTYPSEFPGDPAEWKRHLHNFLRRLAYKFENVSGVWKLEPQKRGAPHYHLMIWGVKYVDLLAFVPEKWYRVVGSGDEKHLRAGTRVEKVRTWRGVMSYCAKYLGKEVKDMPGWSAVGRYWGVFQRDAVPWAELVTVDVTYKQAAQIMRYLRRYAHLKSRSYRSLEIFVNNTEFWFERLDRLLE